VWWQHSLQHEAARGMSAECGGTGEQRWGGEDGVAQDRRKFAKVKNGHMSLYKLFFLSLSPS